jgi:hypothetical protein
MIGELLQHCVSDCLMFQSTAAYHAQPSHAEQSSYVTSVRERQQQQRDLEEETGHSLDAVGQKENPILPARIGRTTGYYRTSLR